MTDMHATVIPKSDQLNYDDVPNGRAITIKITKVSGKTGDQPIAINYEGDGGKPYYPCKSMRRVLIHNWGGNGQDYVGRSLTLYGDPDVRFGGLAVGGIRISHMSHIAKEVTLALTATKASRKPFTVKPLIMGNASNRKTEGSLSPDSLPANSPSIDDYLADLAAVPNIEGLQHKFSEAQKVYKNDPRFHEVITAKDKRKAELTKA